MVEETKELPAINKEVVKYRELSEKALNSEAVGILTGIIKDKITGKVGKIDKFLEEMKEIKESKIIASPQIDLTADLQSNLDKIISIVFYRMKVLMDEQEPLLIKVKDSDKIAIIIYVQEMCTILFDKNSSDNIINFYSSLLLHISQTFIETLNKESIKQGIIIMLMTKYRFKEDTSFLTYDNLENETKSLVAETDDFLQYIYDSPAYEASLKELFNEYNLGEEIQTVKEYVKSLDKNRWIWVKDASFQGMIGMNNKIFINLEDKGMKDIISINLEEKTMEYQEYKTKLTTLILHEGAHQLLRFVRKDFGTLALRTENIMEIENQDMELGYRFEEILFGIAITLPSKATTILDCEKWKKNPPIFTPDQITNQKRNYKKLNIYLSGICPKLIIERFYF